ncbi:unnamed protein product [Ranitomeya imitator]|uniref:Sleeping Beauty transposase HTH domain-containing protein n=1 Tax=Ranitomeya imitator TaxID=111125 RepID=A0ABN9L2P9_9NEOB|nr:unnamed protein product [Ranitomeya imitator]
MNEELMDLRREGAALCSDRHYCIVSRVRWTVKVRGRERRSVTCRTMRQPFLTTAGPLLAVSDRDVSDNLQTSRGYLCRPAVLSALRADVLFFIRVLVAEISPERSLLTARRQKDGESVIVTQRNGAVAIATEEGGLIIGCYWQRLHFCLRHLQRILRLTHQSQLSVIFGVRNPEWEEQEVAVGGALAVGTCHRTLTGQFGHQETSEEACHYPVPRVSVSSSCTPSVSVIILYPECQCHYPVPRVCQCHHPVPRVSVSLSCTPSVSVIILYPECQCHYPVPRVSVSLSCTPSVSVIILYPPSVSVIILYPESVSVIILYPECQGHYPVPRVQRTLLERRYEWRLQHQMQGTALISSAVSCTLRVVPSRHTDGTRLSHVCHTDVHGKHTDTDNSGTDFSGTGIIWTCGTGLRPHSSQCMSDQMRIMRPKEPAKELRDRIVARHRSGQGYNRISAGLKVPKSTVASIILKWRKFVTTRSLPRPGRPAKLSNRRRRALGGTSQITDLTCSAAGFTVPALSRLCEATSLPAGPGSAAILDPGLEGAGREAPSSASSSLTLRQRPRTKHVTAPSDLNVTAEDAKDGAAPGGGTRRGTGRLVAIEGNMNAAKYRDILDENLFQGLWTSDLAEGSPSNKTMTLSTQLK